MIQQDIFGYNASIQQNPLTDRRVGFIGKFKNRAALVKKVKNSYGIPKKYFQKKSVNAIPLKNKELRF